MSLPVTIIHPADLDSGRASGIGSFIRTFVKFAPPDFEIRHVGATRDPGVALGSWRSCELEGREIEALPLLRVDDEVARTRIPIALRFTFALRRARPALRLQGSVLQFHRPATALTLLNAPAPKIQVIHLTASDLLAAHSESRWRRLGKALRLVEAVTLRRMDRVVVVNEEGAEAYRRQYPAMADRIEFVGNWYDDLVFRPVGVAEREAARSEVQALLGASPEDRLLLFAGRLDPQKRPELLLDSLARLHRSDLRLGLVGNGQLSEALVRRLARDPIGRQVRLLGYRDPSGLARLMQGSDLLVIASGHETGPTVALEALASGLPVVGTPVGRLPALLAGNRSGVLAEGMDADALARALAEALSRPREAMSDEAAAIVAAQAASRALGPFCELHRRLAAAR